MDGENHDNDGCANGSLNYSTVGSDCNGNGRYENNITITHGNGINGNIDKNDTDHTKR